MKNNKFTYNNKETDLTLLELWQWKYSDIYDLQDVIAEYIVEKALGLKASQNVGYWTLYDIKYRNMRIEVKETGYYHSWNKPGEKRSKQRVFGITKAYSNYKDPKSKYERQNDVYVFCLNTGKEREDSNPMELNNWEFYIVPTKVINEKCGDNKTISLGRVKELSDKVVKYNELKNEIDRVIDNMDKKD